MEKKECMDYFYVLKCLKKKSFTFWISKFNYSAASLFYFKKFNQNIYILQIKKNTYNDVCNNFLMKLASVNYKIQCINARVNI